MVVQGASLGAAAAAATTAVEATAAVTVVAAAATVTAKKQYRGRFFKLSKGQTLQGFSGFQTEIKAS